ncbi:hypothetical protein D030_1613B, partial [Vibrio parahaemolyticus AQ3810]
AKYVNGRV